MHVKYGCNSLPIKEQGNSSILCFSPLIDNDMGLFCFAILVDLFVISIKIFIPVYWFLLSRWLRLFLFLVPL